MSGNRSSAVTIPAVFSTRSPEVLRGELDRQSSALNAQLLNLPNLYATRNKVLPKVVISGKTSAAFGQWLRVAPLDDDTIHVLLPPPHTRNGGLDLGIIRETSTGAVFVYSPGVTINGHARVLLIGSIGSHRFVFNGENYFSDTQHAIPWGEEL